MTTYKVNTIGRICNNESGAIIQLEPEYIPALPIWMASATSMYCGGSATSTPKRPAPFLKRPSLINRRLRPWASSLPGRQSAPIRSRLLPWRSLTSTLKMDASISPILTQMMAARSSILSHTRLALTGWKGRRFPAGAAIGQRVWKNPRTLPGRMNLISRAAFNSKENL